MSPETWTKLKYRGRWVPWVLMLWLIWRGAVAVIQGPAQPMAAQVALQVDPAESEEAQSFATLFAREYLSWDYSTAAGMSDRARRLEAFTSLEGAGMIPSAARIQTAGFARAWSVRKVGPGRSVVTVAVEVISPAPEPPATKPAQGGATQAAAPQQLPTRRLVYLAVPVAYSGGRYVVPEYPAFVPAPVKGAATEYRPDGESMSDKDNQVQQLLAGFFKALMGGTPAEIGAYMAPGAAAPAGFAGAVAFREIQDLQLYRPKPANPEQQVQAVATVNVQDPLTQGVFRQRYHLTLTLREGRWYVTAVSPGSHM